MKLEQRAKLVELYDTTLRDGAQTKGVHFSFNDKLDIIALLDDFGIDIIEVGWNGANDTDTRLFDCLRRQMPRNSRIAAFCSTYHPSRSADSDPVFVAGTATEVPVMTLFGKSWDLQVTKGLGVSLERNLEIVAESLQYCRSRFDTLVFDAEHFFDGLCANPDYATTVVGTALDVGADRIVLCDTNGGTLPGQIREAMELMRRLFPHANFGIHGHNDTDTAVTNSLVALECGALQVQGTINGIGERCGNTNLCSLIPTLVLKCGYRTRHITPERLSRLYALSCKVAEVVRVPVSSNQPYVGENAFTHKAGVHIAAVLKHPGCYEHVDPQRVGQRRHLVISEQSGRVAVNHKLVELGYGECDEIILQQLVQEIKHLSSQGYVFDKADLSLELLIHDRLGDPQQQQLVVEHLACVPMPQFGATRCYRIELAISLGDGKTYFRRCFSDSPVTTFQDMMLELARSAMPEFETLTIQQITVESLDATRKRAWVTVLYDQPKCGMAIVDHCDVLAQFQVIADCYRWAFRHDARRATQNLLAMTTGVREAARL